MLRRISYRRTAPDLGARIEERSEIRGGANTLAPAWTRESRAVGHVFARWRATSLRDAYIAFATIIVMSSGRFTNPANFRTSHKIDCATASALAPPLRRVSAMRWRPKS